MKILYHPKQKELLGFETFVAPPSFNRKTQPVDIYKVFCKRYAKHKDAKFIYSVMDSFTPQDGLESNEMPLAGANSAYVGFGKTTSFICSYIEDSQRKYEKYKCTTLTSPAVSGFYNVLEVEDTSGFPDPAVTGQVEKVWFGESRRLYSNIPYIIFQYDSKDDTHLYWSGSPQELEGFNSGAVVQPVMKWKGTKRYVLTSSDRIQDTVLDLCDIRGAEWLYIGDGIDGVRLSSANGRGGTMKYIHIIKLDNIVRYGLCWCYGASITGQLHLSRSVSVDAEDWAFRACPNLTSKITIPGTMTEMSTQMFRDCVGIDEIEIEEGVELIRQAAFFNLSNVTTPLVIPSTVVTIEAMAFSNCDFSSIISLSSTIEIDDDVIYDISTYGEVKAVYGRKSNSGTLTLRDDCTEILNYCFYNNKRTGDLKIPSVVTAIRRYAFRGAESMFGLLIFESASNVSVIEEFAFYSSKLTGELVIPDSVLYLGEQAFAFSNFSNLVLGNNIIEIGEQTFRAMRFTSDVIIPDSVKIIRSNAFLASVVSGKNLILGNSLETIESTAFSGCQFTGVLKIPASVLSIGIQAFYLNNFTSIVSYSPNFDTFDNCLYDLTQIGEIKLLANANGYVGTITLRGDTTWLLQACLNGANNRSGNIIIPASVHTISSSAMSNMKGIWDSLIIQSLAIVISANALQGMENVGRTSGGVELPVNYSGNYNDWSFSDYLSADTLDASLKNITDGTALEWKTFLIGATNKARLLAAYPTAETDANVRYINVE